jgi:hypothetical protein
MLDRAAAHDDPAKTQDVRYYNRDTRRVRRALRGVGVRLHRR